MACVLRADRFIQAVCKIKDDKMKKKKIITIGVILAVALSAIFAYMSYAKKNGSLLYKITMTDAVKDYVAEKYEGRDFETQKAEYNASTDIYSCKVISKSSKDTVFFVYQNADGEMIDDYSHYVDGRANTINRLEKEFDGIIDEGFKDKFSAEITLMFCNFYAGKDYAPEKFELDMKADIASPPAPLELKLFLSTEKPEIKELEDYFKEAYRISKESGYDISYYSIKLMGENESNDLSLLGVPKEEIEKDTFSEYISENIKK